MSALSLQPVPEFNPDAEVGASLSTCWKKWLADFENKLPARAVAKEALQGGGGCNGLNLPTKGVVIWVWSLELVMSGKCVYLLVLSGINS